MKTKNKIFDTPHEVLYWTVGIIWAGIAGYFLGKSMRLKDENEYLRSLIYGEDDEEDYNNLA